MTQKFKREQKRGREKESERKKMFCEIKREKERERENGWETFQKVDGELKFKITPRRGGGW